VTNKLGQQEWLVAGLKALAVGGVDAVRVETLATALNVTKGSFYWHFKDRGALLAAVLDAWRLRATDDVISQVEARGGTALERLRALFEIALSADGALDHAIRVWAERDNTVRLVLAQIDQRRFKYLVSLFSALGFSKSAATARSRLVYAALIGQFAARRPVRSADELADYLDAIFPMLVRQT
jgi:AcrR family transcriptional regulator